MHSLHSSIGVDFDEKVMTTQFLIGVHLIFDRPLINQINRSLDSLIDSLSRVSHFIDLWFNQILVSLACFWQKMHRTPKP